MSSLAWQPVSQGYCRRDNFCRPIEGERGGEARSNRRLELRWITLWCVPGHVWRHTYASHLIQNRANLRHVQDLLGHRSLATTERYSRLTITDLKEAHAKFHPREKETAAL
jgi:integrase